MSKRRRDIAFVQSESSRMVTFSKRRKGLFNKASELCTLYGAQVAIIVFSPTGRPFVFGHDSVDGVLYRYLPADSSAEKKVVPDSSSDIDALKQWIEESINRCETRENLISLIQQYSHLLECIKGRLKDMESSRVATFTDSAPSADDILEHEGGDQNSDYGVQSSCFVLDTGCSTSFTGLDDLTPSIDEIFERVGGENQQPMCTI